MPEAQGGAGLALLDAALVSQALGHAATPAPFLSTAVMAATALSEAGGDPAETWLGEIAAGESVWGVAAREILGPLNIGLVGLMLACLLAAMMSSVASSPTFRRIASVPCA